MGAMLARTVLEFCVLVCFMKSYGYRYMYSCTLLVLYSVLYHTGTAYGTVCVQVVLEFTLVAGGAKWEMGNG